MATIKDVSKYTGLSLATISKYLNGGNVRPANRAIIDEAVGKLGYTVNINARSLKTNCTKIIGVVMPTMSVPFFGGVLNSLDMCLREAGYNTFTCSYNFDKELEFEKLKLLTNNNVDGVVLAPQFLSPQNLEQIRENLGENRPLVLLDRTVAGFPCDSVVVDNLNAVYEAVERLINAGHRRIGIIVGPINISTASERMRGYRRALSDYGLISETNTDAAMVKIGSYDFESGYSLFNEFMEMDNPPTALCVTNYDMTLGAVTAARERGVVLGQDVGFVGFDAEELCRLLSPALSIVEQPTAEMGRQAGELLLRRIAKENIAYPQVLRLKARLHWRE